ncbi:MAG: hypothetical protein V4648_09045 [Bacteroidota bacterium]
MKTKILLLLILVTKITFAQDSIKTHTSRVRQTDFSTEKRTHIFSVSPMSRKTGKVDGLVLGFGHIDNKLVEKQTINGLNIEVNPAPAVGALALVMGIMYLPESLHKKRQLRVIDTLQQTKKPDFHIPSWEKTPRLKLNGLNISTGCFFTNTSMNGLNISCGNKFENFNGISIAPLGTLADCQNGVAVGLINANNDLNGFVVGAYNQSEKLDGLQIGLVNQSITNHGLQIGIFNRSYSKGFQIGLWNKNPKRSLPIFNW